MEKIKQDIKRHKKDIIFFVIIFILSLIMCSAFLRAHYTHDTYNIIYCGYEFYSYDKFLKEARPFTAIVTMLAALIELPIEAYSVISFIFAILFLSISVVLVYKIFRNKYQNSSKWISFLILLISYVVIYNYFALEYIYFLEAGMQALGVLLSVIAAKMITDKKEYGFIKAGLLIVVAAFCYQGAIAVFPMLIFVYTLLFEDNKPKKDLATIIKVAVIYGISMLLTILFSKLIMGGSRINMDLTRTSLESILYWIKELAINSLGVILPYFNIIVIGITTLIILTLKKSVISKKIYYMLKYWLVIVVAIVITIAPIIVGSGLSIFGRMALAYGSTIGLSLLIILLLTEQTKSKFPTYILSIMAIIIFGLNFALYVVATYQHLEVNRLDKEKCQQIKQIVEEYEEKTNIKVTKISGTYFENGDHFYPGHIHLQVLTRSALDSWCLRETITYYIGRHLTYAPMKQEIMAKFYSRSPSDIRQQVIIEGDVLYYCGN